MCVFLLGAHRMLQPYTFICINTESEPVAASVWFYYVLRSYRDHPRASVYIFIEYLRCALVRREPLCISLNASSDKKYIHTHARTHSYYTMQHRVLSLSLSLSLSLLCISIRLRRRKSFRLAFDFFPITKMIY
jgi:hypothetical protein